MNSLVAPECWLSVEDFTQQMNRVIDSGVIFDGKIALQVMRVIYDRAENDPDSYYGIDMKACGEAILRLERAIGKK